MPGVFLLLFLTDAKADICYEVNDQTAAKAITVIEKQKEIYKYCSLCENAESQHIWVENTGYDTAVYVNGQAIDLAHTYYKEGDKYVNLEIAAGCIKDGDYGILADLDNLSEMHHSKENDKKQAKQKAAIIFDECVNNVENDKSKTTQDMIERNIKITDCLAQNIKQEIKKGFHPKQQARMIEYFEQTRKGTWSFYNEIYTANKYCYGQCGSFANLLPYNDEENVLMQMLESLLYLNMAKNGY